MIDPTYAPFPELELKALARWHEQAADTWKVDSRMRLEHERRRQVCLDAIASHTALRERCLLAELELHHGVTEDVV